MATGRQHSGQSRSDATRRRTAAKTLLWGVEIILPISGSDKEAPHCSGVLSDDKVQAALKPGGGGLAHRYYSWCPEGDGEHVEA
jgi:hypothetical protein